MSHQIIQAVILVSVHGKIHVYAGTAGVTTNSATASNCVSLYDLRGIHLINLIPNPNLLRRIYLARVFLA